MRHLLIAFAAAISAIVAAQTVSAAGSGPQHAMPGAATAPPVHQVPAPPTTAPPPPPAPPPQPVGPPIVFPFPPLMTPPAGGLTPPAGGLAPEFVPPPPGRAHSPHFGRFGSPFFAPFVTGYSAVADSVVARPSAPVATATGFLRLSVTPSAAQVFIDSYYVGTVADIDAQRVLTLEAGPHRIEFRAPQYQTLTVDLRIMPHELVTYRAALEPARPAVPAASALTASPSPMYLIPNCYLGNVPPRPSRLPAGCDISKVQVLGSK